MDALLSLLGSFARVEALGGEGSAFVDGREVARFSAFSVAFFGADGATLRFRADSGDLAWWLGGSAPVQAPAVEPAVTVEQIRALVAERPHLSFSVKGLLDRSIVQLHGDVLRVQLTLWAKHLVEFLPGATPEGLVDLALAYRQWDAASHALAHEAHEAEIAAQEVRKQARKDAIAAASSWLLDGNKFAGRCRCCSDEVRAKRGYYDRRNRTTICDSCLDGVLGLSAPAPARAEAPKTAPASDRGWWARECRSDRDA